MADCDEPVLIHDAVDTVDLILPDAVPRFSKSPVLRCFFNFNPYARKFRIIFIHSAMKRTSIE